MPTTITTQYYRRFDLVDRVLHALLMVSFLGVSITGLPLLFNDSRWAAAAARALGGVAVAGVLHRMSATLMLGIFAFHLGRVAKRAIVDGEAGLLWGPDSMVPQPRDIREIYQHLRWFVGLGEKPRFARYTYWEKFDYWAVFWGMGIIGLSGLMLWFPSFFARLVPGWVFNVAMLVHGEEALLAVAFIFTVHFFNTHMRPGKFPMDPVIFTGSVSERELRLERPEEYEQLVARGGLASQLTAPSPRWVTTLGRAVAAVAVSLGLAIVVLIILTLAVDGR